MASVGREAPTMNDYTQPKTRMEEKLQSIWAHVLNLLHVPLDQSFLAVGGDSISAMQVVGQCRKDGVGLGVQEVLRSRSIPQLAEAVKEIEHKSYESMEYFDEEFDLTPIQSLYFQRPNVGRGHFNQSFYLQVKRRTTREEFQAAVEQLVARHSMLRARFSHSHDLGWKQSLTNDVSGSYRFRHREVASKVEIDVMIANSQLCLDHVHGPLFAADLFDLDKDQFAFLTAHHIVIDLVSWRLLLEELEEILRGGELLPTALPFQKWAELQAEHAETLELEKVLPPVDVPPLDFDYWDIQREDNTYGNASHALFELDSNISSVFLTNCHSAFKTEPVELLLASLIQSWSHVFIDRPIPAIFNESHGREPWSSDIDISRTVGWFTALSPILVSPSQDPTETVRKVKDFKRRIPGNGRPYFARRCLTEQGRDSSNAHWPMEILFNYLGQYQQLERTDALLQPLDTMAGEYRAAGGTSDFGHITPRWGLFEISAIVFKGRLKFAFTFNRHMRHQKRIHRWVAECQKTLCDMIEKLVIREPTPTSSDFPLLPLAEDGFNAMLASLKVKGIAPMDVEDAYLCSNMQEGLLLSQNKDAGFYAAATLHELKSRSGRLEPVAIAKAWRQIVQRHPALRTVFLENFGTEGLYSQVVLKSVDANIVYLQCETVSEAVNAIKDRRSISYSNGKCQNHRFTICTTPDGRAFCSLDISHTIMDGQSMSLLACELRQACEGQLRGHGTPYSDYIAWLKQQPQEASLEFWKSYLDGSEVCSFPALNDGTTIEKQLVSIRMDMDNFSMPDLQNFCNSNGITLSNIFHTAWALTLSLYVGSKDVTFGYLTSARDADEIHRVEAMVGPMINTLVCRVNLSESSRCLLDVLQDVQRDYMEALPHRHIALADVQHVLDLSGASLFNTALSYRRLPPDTLVESTVVELIEVAPIYDPTEYPVSVNIEIGDTSAAVDLDYWSDFMSAGQATNVTTTFRKALENIVYNSKRQMSDLDHLSYQNWQQILAWNVMPRTMNECVHSKFGSWVTLQPEAPAICGFDGEYNYAQLAEITDRLAYHLVTLGVGPEVLVPTCFDKSAFAIVAMLSVLKAGGAAVPLDAKHPRPALQTRLEDCAAKVVLTTASRAKKLEGLTQNIIVVDGMLLDNLPAQEGAECTTVQPNNPCFVIFTSGSTGRPKGVVLEHAAMVTSAEAHGSKLGIGPGSRVLQFASYTFDNSLEEMFTSLQRGACVCIPSEDQRVNDLPGAIAELNANFMDLTPTVAALLKPADVPSIEALALGAEPLTKALIESWRPHVRVYGQYGPSEASINSAWRDFTNGGEATNIGKAIGSVSWVVDPDNRHRLMVIGGKGELCIEGPILSRGYLNDPEKTALAFIMDPEWAQTTGPTGRRFYCTGDLVQYTSEGEMIYMGRKDSQVKLNGQRVELGEIEHHLKLNLPEGTKSAVELVKFSENKALIGFICIDADSSVAPGIGEMTDSVRAIAKKVEVALGEVLPAYYVPVMFMPVTSMPMTTSGKLDRKVLRQLAADVPETQMAPFRLAGNSGRVPSGHIEITLASLWAEVLKLSADTVGAEDSFFRLGGDSISAMRLVSASRKRGVILNVANVFAQPKLAEMATTAAVISSDELITQADLTAVPFELIEKGDRQRIISFAATECGVFPDAIEDIYPCSRLQEGLISLSTRDPGSYVAQPTYRLPSAIDIPRFKAAWNKVIAHEAILRTRVIHNDEFGFLQVVVKEEPQWQTLAHLDDISEAHRRLPATPGGPLISFTTVGEGTDSPLFIWTAHHAVYDGWSWSTLFNQVESCYRDLSSELPASIPFSRFVKYLSTLKVEDSDQFWITHLKNITAPQFPQLPTPDYKVQAISQLVRSVKMERRSDMEVTIPSFIRAAWGLLLATYSGSDDVLWGETNSGREAPVPDIESIVGPTLTTAPVRLQLNRDLTIREYLRETQRQASATLPHQFAGLQHIRKLSSETKVACDFQSFLGIVAGDNLQDVESDLWSMQSTGTLGTNFFSYALVFNCTVEKDNISIEVLYDSQITEIWYIERLLQQFDFFINRFNSSEHLDRLLSEIDLVNTTDMETITSWNRAPVPRIERCIHNVILEDATVLRPTAIAIEAWDTGAMSYRELDERANALASRLILLGVKPESFVPLCFDKSGWTIVAILAVLKAGAAFVPLDFEAPVLRLQELVSDVKAELILCATKYEQLCQSMGCNTLAIDRSSTEKHHGSENALPHVQSDSIAYAFYTSGSTGKPKGAVINHSCWVSSSSAFAPTWNISASSRVLQFASYIFDACLIEIFSTLMCGGTVCVPDQDSRTNDLVGVINKFDVNWATLTPSVVRMMQPSQVPNLKTLVLVGEAMSQQDLITWADCVTLGNGYGPTECSAISTSNVMTLRTKPNNLGKAVTSRGWIVSRNNHHILTPVAAVGELLLEGPAVGAGYLNDTEKTAQAFLSDVKWGVGKLDSSETRLYKTGDLAKYNEDGTMLYLGRKDSQTKVRGQRLELSEVEHHLMEDGAVQNALAAVPASGPCAKRLVGIVSIKDAPLSGASTQVLQLLPQELASLNITTVRDHLCQRLPAYMIPSLWVAITRFPLTPGGKMDRRRVVQWLERMDTDMYRTVSTLGIEEGKDDANVTELKLQGIFAKVLNLPVKDIRLNQSFLHLGGDSIAAMQVSSQCRSQGLAITVQELIRAKSITALAAAVATSTSDHSVTTVAQEYNLSFDLSPIQRVFLSTVGDAYNYFNQAELFRVARTFEIEDIKTALSALVKIHPMLRARFARNEANKWQQKIEKNVDNSVRLRQHRVADSKNSTLQPIINDSQSTLNIISGPVFAVDVFDLDDTFSQAIAMVAHHLVIDVVSWGIILEDFQGLLNGASPPPQSLSYHAWLQQQAVQANQGSASKVFPVAAVTPANSDYWGMEGQRNINADVVEHDMALSTRDTMLLLGAQDALGTEILDILVAALLESFRKTFPDRSTVTIHNEGHGRETFDAKQDLTRTVGWFSTLSPIHLPVSPEDSTDIASTIRWVKDVRERTPGKGRPYFAYRQLTEVGQTRFSSHWPAEVIFNYHGRLQHLDRQDALFHPLEGVDSKEVGDEVPRLALFDITAAISQGAIKMSFGFNRHMERQNEILAWIQECRQTLVDAVDQLLQVRPERSLSDFKLLPLTYDGMSRLSSALPIGTSLADIEDVYPASPMQQGLLLTQMKHPELYVYHAILEVQCADAARSVDPRRVAEAWQVVVHRHPALRTIFIDSLARDGSKNQVVLKAKIGRTKFVTDCDDSDVAKTLREQPGIDCREALPPHSVTICKTKSGRVWVKLELSHAINDGTSITNILSDLSRAYERKLTRADVGPLYRDFIAHIISSSQDAGLAYWKTYLSGVEPCFFPNLNDGKSGAHEHCSVEVNISDTAVVQDFCKKNGVTLSNVLQLTWALVLHYFVGASDVSFGVVASGRDVPVKNIEEAVGVFVNMLIARLTFSDETTIAQLLESLQTDSVNALAHQACSLADVQNELQLPALFNSAFTFQRRSLSRDPEETALVYENMEAEDPGEYAITVNADVSEEEISVDFGYWMDKVCPSQAQNMADTFEKIVNNIISSDVKQLTVGKIDAYTANSMRQIFEWNAHPHPPISRCVHEVVHEQASTRPRTTKAIDGHDGAFTYQEFDKITDQLAFHLQSIGVTTETFVPILFEKSSWAIISMIAIMKAGGAYVPLDPNHPETRLQELISDVGAKVVLCSRTHHARATEVAATPVIVDAQAFRNLRLPSTAMPKPSATPANAAYCLFTSGTTGKPKGTIIPHEAFCTSAAAFTRRMNINATSRTFQFASYTFDASCIEILSALTVGATVCVPSEEERMNNPAGAIRRLKATWSLLTPSVLGTIEPDRVPCLKTLVAGGEALPGPIIRKWGTSTCFINAYGPTECAVVAATCYKSTLDHKLLETEPGTIGTGSGCRLWVVHPRNHDKLMPVGSIGELVVEGATVARGYLNDEVKTAKAFIENPAWVSTIASYHAGFTASRMYKSGDLVRYNSDGSVSYIGRKDTQIKLNGQRIELGEVEFHVAKNFPEHVQSAVELVAPSNRSAKALAVFFALVYGDSKKSAYVIQPVSTDLPAADELLLPMSDDLRDMCKSTENGLGGSLPSYMIPAIFVPIRKMPWTSAGKLDRNRLRNLVQNLSREAMTPYRLSSMMNKKQPASAAERKLHKIVSTVLNLPPSAVGIDDSFIRLGGNSILAMRLVAAAQSEHMDLSVIDIFTQPKLSDLAAKCGPGDQPRAPEKLVQPFELLQSAISPAHVIEEVSQQCRVQRAHVQDVLPVSALQEALCMLSIKQTGAYVAQHVLDLAGSVDVDKLKNAWEQAVQEVDILRTRIVQLKSGKFMQVVLANAPIYWVESTSLDDVKEDAKRIPEHIGAPLTSYSIVRTAANKKYFIWTIHHSLYDGWSIALMLQRVQQIYQTGHSDLPHTSYKKFIKFLADADTSASKIFWKRNLAGASTYQYPQQTHVAAEVTPTGQTLQHTMKRASRRTNDVTPSNVIRAAWAILLAAYTGSDDVVFGETLTGRDISVAGITEICGPTLTTVPTRVQVSRIAIVTDLLKLISANVTERIPHQHVGLSEIRRLSEDTAAACNFRNLLVIQPADEDFFESMWSVHDNGSQGNFFTYPLVIECSIGQTNVDFLAHYHENVISTFEVQRLLYSFESVLTQLSSVTQVRDIRVFSEQDAQLLRTWNAVEPTTIDETIPALFYNTVERQPNSIAVSAFDGEFTYAELGDSASRLAQELISLGAGPEHLIPTCLDKSRWAVVAIMAILIAGAGYVPLSPSYPASRQQQIIADCKASIVLCSPEYQFRFAGAVTKVVGVSEASVLNLPATLRSLPLRAKSSNTCYVIYTSGSTGVPKGVVVEHRAIASSSAAICQSLRMTSTSRVFQFCSFLFDVSVGEILTPLTCGATICIPSEQQLNTNVAAAITSLAATWASLTPSVACLFDGPQVVPTLKTLVVGGEAMTPEVINKFAAGLDLYNGYGPTEGTVFAVTNDHVSTQRDATNIGQVTRAGRSWLTSPTDPHQLAPLGAIAELCIEGPFLARGYLNNPEKTAESFVQTPAFMKDFTKVSSTRIYRTGDLVRYATDGSIIYIGSKDNQVKLAGQRIELGDIEHHLQTDANIRHAVVQLPRSGPGKGKLIATISLASNVANSNIDDQQWRSLLLTPDIPTQIKIVKERLSDLVPPYMMPTVWAIVPRIPLLASTKVDRKQVGAWLETLDEASFQQILDIESVGEAAAPVSDAAMTLQRLCAAVLVTSVDEIKTNRSWLSLGGDSITAMQLLAKCRTEGIHLALNQVLRAKTLAHLARSIEPSLILDYGNEETGKIFALSPIQQVYFGTKGNEMGSHFNQSFTTRLGRTMAEGSLKAAFDQIVECHSMLRARFTKNKGGQWQQVVLSDPANSYAFRTHSVITNAEVVEIIATTQKSLDIQKGPVFAVDVISVSSGEQIVFIAAHHLVIDVVSWRIILGDLEDLLVGVTAHQLPKALSFQNWCDKQASHARITTSQETVRNYLPTLHPTDLAFWGMENRSNVYGDVERDDFTINADITTLALNTNGSLKTDVVDLLLAAILHSFSRVFINRKAPTIFNESHGREPWDESDIDLSRTVGWFTTLYPITVAIAEDEDEVVHTIRQVKDLRRRIKDNGRPYFAHRLLSGADDNQQATGSEEPMEVLFNYLGNTQQVETDGSLFQPVPFSEDDEEMTFDVGMKTARLALFELSAAVVDSQLHMNFMYNRWMKNQKGIRRWIAECHRTFEEMVTTLAEMKVPQPTITDFPLLPLESYERLDRVLKTLPAVGITSYNQVEDIYPCSAIQEGMLLSQIKDPDSYWSFTAFEVKSKRGAVESGRLAKAWQRVVDRHQALRTVMVDSVCKGGVFDQIVVKHPDTGLVTFACTDAELTTKLASIKYGDLNGKKRPHLPHQAAVVQMSSGRIVVKIIVNHAVIDGGSLAIIGRDLEDAYEGTLSDDEGPLYSDYIKHIRSLDSNVAINYWKNQLSGVKPCYFPPMPQQLGKPRQLHSLDMRFQRFTELHALAESKNVSLANILLAAWALVLRSYSGFSDVCYGYLTSGRNVPVDDVENAVGAFINMLVSRIQINTSGSLLDIIQKVQDDFIESVPYQHCSLAQFQHDLGLSGKALFNTAVSIQNSGASQAAAKPDTNIEFEQIGGYDASEYVITLNIDATRGDEAVRFAYWTDSVSDGEANNVSSLMVKILTQTLADPVQTVVELDVAITDLPTPANKSPLPSPPSLSPTLTFAPRMRPRTMSSRSSSSLHIPRIHTPRVASVAPLEAPDWTHLIRSIVAEMVPQIVDQVIAKNKTIRPESATAATINEMTSQMTGMIARRASISQREKPNLETGSIYSRGRRMSVTSNAESRIQTAAEMVAAAGVLATGAMQSPDFVEKKLLGLWSELLDMVEDTIEKDDSFFNLGGDSIIAMRLVGAAREEGLSMTVADVFKNPKFADMTRVVRVAGEVIDEVISRAGGGSVHGKDQASLSDPTQRVPARAAALWDDFQSVILEYKGDEHGTRARKPLDEPEEARKDAFKKWQGLTASSPPRRPQVFRRTSSRSFVPQTIQEGIEAVGPKSISLLGDPNVDSVISKVQVFKGGISDVFPVTDFQALAITGSLLESKWMLNYFFLEGDGPLELRKLKQSAYRICQVFDILRTVFVPYGDRFLQVVLRKLQPDFIYQQTDDSLETFTTELRQKDREHGPRLGEAFTQFVVVKQKQTSRYRIFMRLSHAQYDGVCIGKILEALQAGYNGLPVLSAPSFGNFVRESAKTVAGAHDHWRETLRGSKMTEIVNRFGPNYQRSAGSTITLERKMTVRSLSRLNITAATIIKGAWAAALAKIAGKSDIVFGHVISGRNSGVANIENVVGPCLNTVPVRVVYRPEWVVLDLLRYIQDQQIANMPYESLGFREIIRHCTEWPDWTNFSSVLQHDQNITDEKPTLQLGGIEFSLGAAGTQQDFADFSINSTSRGGTHLDIALTYAPNSTITAEYAENVFEMLCGNVVTFSEDPHAMLPSPSELSSQSSTTINSDQMRKKSEQKAAIALPTDAGLSKHEVNTLATTMRSAWQQILYDEHGAPVNIELASDFFQLGGDIMGLAQVASILADEGFRVRVEDLLDKSMFVDQVSVLIVERKKQIEKEEQSEKSPWGAKSKSKKTETNKMKSEKKSGLGALARKIGLRKK